MAKNTQLQVIGQYLQNKVDRIGELMPRNSGVTPQKLIRVALMAINENTELLNCTPESVYASLLESARLGLEVGGPLAQAYLVPYKRKGVSKAVFQISYRGLIDLVMRNGNVRQVGVEFVHQGDLFDRELGILGKFVHKAANDDERESRPITHVYAEFLLYGTRPICSHGLKVTEYSSDERIIRHVMTTKEINEHAKRFSRSWDDPEGPWKTNWKAMAAKTVIRQPILHGQVPIRLREEEQRYVMDDESPSASIRDLAGTFGQPEEIECDSEGEIMTDEEKAAIEAAEAAAEV